MKLKKLFAYILIFCLCSCVLVSCTKNDNSQCFIELGIPTSEKYTKGVLSRCVWDMKYYNGYLYIGSGDYDNNTGPTDIWGYNILSKKWVKSGTVNDEAVTRFVCLDDTLLVPGVDPKEEWSLGNFYKLQNNQWTKIRTLPSGIHNFDLIKYENKLFAALGVAPGYSPIVFSSDNGEIFNAVLLYKNNGIFNEANYDKIRAYELFTYDEKLYSVIRYYVGDESKIEIFYYDDEKMIFLSDITPYITEDKTGINLFGAKAQFGNKFFIATDYLYKSTDLINIEKVLLPNGGKVSDFLICGNFMYILSFSLNNNKTYDVKIYKTDDGEVFQDVISFSYDVPPICFEKVNDDFYVGMGNKIEINSYNGMVLKLNKN